MIGLNSSNECFLYRLYFFLYCSYNSCVLVVRYLEQAFFFSSHLSLISWRNHDVLLGFLLDLFIWRVPSTSAAASLMLPLFMHS